MTETTQAKVPPSTKKRATSQKPPAPQEQYVTKQELNNITAAIEKLATLTGNGNMLREFGMTRWNPTRKDMNPRG
jgi:hypothetical protein